MNGPDPSFLVAQALHKALGHGAAPLDECKTCHTATVAVLQALLDRTSVNNVLTHNT